MGDHSRQQRRRGPCRRRHRRGSSGHWQEGNNIVNLGSFLLLLKRFGEAGERAAAERALAQLFAWHERLQEPSTGFWGVGQHADPERLLHAFAGSMHNFHLWYATGRELPHQDRAVDYVLTLPPVPHSACIDVDAADVLVHACRLIDHRRPESTAWLMTMLVALLDEQNPDGGFCDTRVGEPPAGRLGRRLCRAAGPLQHLRDLFLLWAEIPVYWAIDFAAPAPYADVENQLLELVARDFNRASVIVWGVGNENADTDARLAFMSGLARAARRSDSTRLVAAACLVDREHFAIADRLAEHLDLIGLNEYFGWYEPDFADLERLLANSSPGKPVLVSETGADAMPGRRDDGRGLFTEDWQAALYREQLARLDEAPYVRGMAAWLLYDFRSPRHQTGFQQGFSRKGLIAEDKTTKKRTFTVLSELYASRCRPLVRTSEHNPLQATG